MPTKVPPDLKGATLRRVDAAWRLSKDMRLGQLIFNAVQQNDDDLFYISDEDLCLRLKDICDYRDILERVAESANGISRSFSPADKDPMWVTLERRLDAWRNAK